MKSVDGRRTMAPPEKFKKKLYHILQQISKNDYCSPFSKSARNREMGERGWFQKKRSI